MNKPVGYGVKNNRLNVNNRLNGNNRLTNRGTNSNNKNTSSNYYKIKKNTVRNGFNTVGTVGVWYSLIGIIIFVVLLLALMVYFNFFYHKGWVKIDAELLDENCRESRNNKDNTIEKCNYKIKYTVNDKEYVSTMYNKSRIYPIQMNNKKMLHVEYDPSNPHIVDEVFEVVGVNIVLGVILFVMIVIGAILYNYRNNTIVKGLATAHMVSDMIRR